ncbi:methyltransferase domain-containing protein [Deinococcus peraridilitoris]|uniref:Putative N6-adenine-specific DNA methylase n=1 Tax=Deinococcus peraridilitoris (strain DSM 19664 / LMG 22246 / CIP 109416 / KR-200) TaxID=937777 RepID=K9ZY40_DEIPD|nr:50S ribosomal protein L11 methyltransferase [Deinococcus peraridilitoris]AFZ66521.1 putative N6-adenine-specific DNA methylase [Deinococcus peraridilitoris DSM 19664]
MQERVYELEVLSGLERFAREELSALRGARSLGELRFTYDGSTRAVKRLLSAVAAYEVEYFDVPRPKALLGHQHLTRLLRFVEDVLEQDTFKSFRFSAAGRETAVFARLAQEVERACGLRHDPKEGELLLRFVRAGEGWEVLARLTPRPLSARSWRVCNMAGGLNATLAHAMLRLGGVRSGDRVFNPMCGSGTLLIERAALGASERLVGADVDERALECARQNVAVSKHQDIEIGQMNVVEAELPARAFDLIVADLPWGDAVGSHASNAELYPAFLRAMAHVGSKNARLVVLTHEVTLFERLLQDERRWTLRESMRVYHGGHYPRMYLLTK